MGDLDQGSLLLGVLIGIFIGIGVSALLRNQATVSLSEVKSLR